MRAPISRVWRRVLALASPPDERRDLLADLDDEAAQRASTEGAGAARRWYRRQVLRSVGPMLNRRLFGGAGPASIGRGLLQELRIAARSLLASPGFTLAALAMLTIGIGAHTTIYAVVDAMLLRPLPYGDRSPRLVTMQFVHPTLAPDWRDAEMSYPDFADIRRESASFEQVEAAIGRNLSISTGTETMRVLAASMTPGMLRMLGESPVIGRDFRDDEAAEPGVEQVAIIGYGLWQSLLGGDRAAVGRTVLVNARPITVVGVMPQGFMFPDEHQMWLPYRGREDASRANRGTFVAALLRPGVSITGASAEVAAIASRLSAAHPESNRDWSAHVAPIRDSFVSAGDVAQLLGAVSLLLFVACANVAGLFVARGLARQRELTLRAALGAGRLRLVRLLVMESAVVAATSGALGIVLAGWSLRALVAWIPEPPPYWATPAIDLRVASFAIALTGVVVLIAGLVPALRLSRVDAGGAIAPGARVASATPGHRRVQHALVAGQVAMSLVLLTGATLLGRSATALMTADAGFDRGAILSTRFYMAGDRYNPIDARATAVHDVIRRVSEVPGVLAVAATGSIPSDDGGQTIRLLSPLAGASAEDRIGAQAIAVTPEFWSALNLRLDAGRTFTDAEAAHADADVVIVNRRLAALLWPGQDAIGRTLRVAGDAGPIAFRVIGVAPDLVYEEFTEETPQSRLNVYIPYIRSGSRTQALLIRAAGEPGALGGAVREAVRSVDPGFAVFDTLTMADRRAYNHWSDAFVGRTFWTFALAAMLLACVGAYGISAYGVAQRRREIGVRLAIGARRGDILGLFLASGLRVAVAGAIVGLPAAAGVARVLENDLFRVSPWEPGLWLGLPAVLAAAVIAASYLPARRAARVDPAITLRE